MFLDAVEDNEKMHNWAALDICHHRRIKVRFCKTCKTIQPCSKLCHNSHDNFDYPRYLESNRQSAATKVPTLDINEANGT
jgi:hypothetical protein